MPIVDPREEYDDLEVVRTAETVSPADFETLAATETARVGWAVGALVFDDAGRVLLVDNYWADGWIVPSGGVKPGESLTDAVVREIREEGGVEATPIRPHAVSDSVTVNEETGESFESSFVLFEAAAERTTIDDDLGETAAEIDDARWFDRLPADVYNRELTERVYRRCRGDDTP